MTLRWTLTLILPLTIWVLWSEVTVRRAEVEMLWRLAKIDANNMIIAATRIQELRIKVCELENPSYICEAKDTE